MILDLKDLSIVCLQLTHDTINKYYELSRVQRMGRQNAYETPYSDTSLWHHPAYLMRGVGPVVCRDKACLP